MGFLLASFVAHEDPSKLLAHMLPTDGRLEKEKEARKKNKNRAIVPLNLRIWLG